MARMAVAVETLEELRRAALADVDPDLVELIGRELERQRGTIELIVGERGRDVTRVRIDLSRLR